MSSSQSNPVTSDMDYSDLYLNVVLRDVNNEESFPIRHFPVGSTWSFRIGRGSQNEDKLNPRAHNSWFGSRVMSREHAEVTVDQMTREIKIADLSSMHGTYMYGKMLNPREKTKLYPYDVVTFGTDVVRGENTYRPLQLKFEFEWSDGAGQSGFTPDRYQGSFMSEHGDIEVLGGTSALPASPHPLSRPLTFSVPDSDGSDSSSDEENQQSSPLTFDEDDVNEVTEISPIKFLSAENAMPSTNTTSETPLPNNCSQVIVIEDEQTHHSKEDTMVDVSKIFEQAKEVVSQADDLADYGNEDEDADDHDFDSEAADFHMHVSDEDDVSSDEDNLDAVGDEAESLDPVAHDHIQVAEFLQPVVSSVAPDVYDQAYGPFSSEIDLTLPSIRNLYDLDQGNPQTFCSSTMGGTHVVTEAVHRPTSETPQGSGRVSIHNILNEADVPTGVRLKRKADVLVDPKSEDIVAESPSVSVSLPNLQAGAQNGVKSEDFSEEPSRKVPRLENESRKETSRSRTFLKYTATAVAGAAVGAVTAVLGLAALPAEYFV